MDYILTTEQLRGWEDSFSKYSWFKKDRQGVLWQAYDNGIDQEMQFRTLTDKLGENGRMSRSQFQELFRE